LLATATYCKNHAPLTTSLQANSNKNHLRQCLAALYTRRLQLCGHHVRGFMVESNINGGTQKLVPGVPLKHGVSITDACISLSATRVLLQTLNTMRMTDPQTIEETRKAIRLYDEALMAQLQGNVDMEFPSNLPFAKERYHVCMDEVIYELCARVPGKTERLSMLCSQVCSANFASSNLLTVHK
jgi:hypothetical protein